MTLNWFFTQNMAKCILQLIKIIDSTAKLERKEKL